GAGGFDVNALDRDGQLRKNRQLIVLHLGDAAFEIKEALFAALEVELHAALAELDQERGAIGENADFTVMRRQNRLRDGLVENLLLGGDDDNVEGHRGGHFMARGVGASNY